LIKKLERIFCDNFGTLPVLQISAQKCSHKS
jgi:hypothetical protein